MNYVERRVLKRMLAESQFEMETETNKQLIRDQRRRSDALTDFAKRCGEANENVSRKRAAKQAQRNAKKPAIPKPAA